MYVEHPSKELTELFLERPFQGAEPSTCTFLFVGLDANYGTETSGSDWFENVLEYHKDGVKFWERHGVHHPFLLPNYHGDGRQYHKNFSKIGFKSNHASMVSFVELLDIPTVGRSRLVVSDLKVAHLKWLDQTIMNGGAEHVFLSAGVIRLMMASKVFPWLSNRAVQGGALPILYSRAGKYVYKHLHFSNYGKFQQRMEEEWRAIAALLPK